MKEYGERTAAPEEDTQETVLTGGGHPTGQTPNDKDATVLTGVSAVTSAAAAIMGRYREKFVKEARTIARLDHPGIVRIHDVFEENGTAYYVMDFIEGENLNDLVKREGALPEERALGYIRQVADALSYVHGHNIMHLDVKPANIIVRKSDDKAILIDFGTAKQYDSEGSQTSTTPVGLSVGYAPIEMTKPGGVQTFSPETDVYSLGATLYYLVTGQNPPDASERMEMIMEGEKFQLPESISSSTIEVIEQSMQARKKRIQNVNGFLELLNSDGEKRRLEAEEKAAKEAEAKRQEALRIEREKEEAEKKRIAEEKARAEAEAKRQEALRLEQEKAEAEKKRVVEKEAQNKKTMMWALIALAAVVGVLILIPNINNSSYSYSSSSGDGPVEMSAADILGETTSNNTSSTNKTVVIPDPVLISTPKKNIESTGDSRDVFTLEYENRMPQDNVSDADISGSNGLVMDSSLSSLFPESYKGINRRWEYRSGNCYLADYLSDDNYIVLIYNNNNYSAISFSSTTYLVGVFGNLLIIQQVVGNDVLASNRVLSAIDFTSGSILWSKKLQTFTYNYPILENTIFATRYWDDENYNTHSQLLLIDVFTGKNRKTFNLATNGNLAFNPRLNSSRDHLYVEYINGNGIHSYLIYSINR